MNLLDPISTIMTSKVYTLSEHASIEDAKKLFSNYRIHHIPIVEGGKLLGMLSKSDFLGFMNGREETPENRIKMKAYNVSMVMTKGIATLDASQKINVALQIFTENLFHAIPILEDGELAGIITTFDIIKQLNKDGEAHSTYSN